MCPFFPFSRLAASTNFLSVQFSLVQVIAPVLFAVSPTCRMSSAAELLAKAAEITKGGAPAAKRMRQQAPDSQPSADTELLAVVERCMRLSLQTSEKAEASFCATNLVCLVKEAGDQAKMSDQMATWVSMLPEFKLGMERKPHELGEKRVFLFLCFLELLKNDPDLAGADGTVPKTVDSLLDTKVTDLSRWIAGFKPRVNEPKAGRPWVWELALSSLCPDKFRGDLDFLSSRIDTARWKIAPHRWGQTGLNKAVWDDVKRLAAARRN